MMTTICQSIFSTPLCMRPPGKHLDLHCGGEVLLGLSGLSLAHRHTSERVGSESTARNLPMAFCAERAAYAAVGQTSQHYREEAARVRREAKIVANEVVRLQLLNIAQQYDLLADGITRADLYRGYPPI
jgi:hypothetical protein